MAFLEGIGRGLGRLVGAKESQKTSKEPMWSTQGVIKKVQEVILEKFIFREKCRFFDPLVPVAAGPKIR